MPPAARSARGNLTPWVPPTQIWVHSLKAVDPNNSGRAEAQATRQVLNGPEAAWAAPAGKTERWAADMYRAAAAAGTQGRRSRRGRGWAVTPTPLLPEHDTHDDGANNEDTKRDPHDDTGAEPAVLLLACLIVTVTRCAGRGRSTGRARCVRPLGSLQRAVLGTSRNVLRQRAVRTNEAIPIMRVRELQAFLPGRQGSGLDEAIRDLASCQVRELGTQKGCSTRDICCRVRSPFASRYGLDAAADLMRVPGAVSIVCGP